jgi:hypothetical protein
VCVRERQRERERERESSEECWANESYVRMFIANLFFTHISSIKTKEMGEIYSIHGTDEKLIQNLDIIHCIQNLWYYYGRFTLKINISNLVGVHLIIAYFMCYIHVNCIRLKHYLIHLSYISRYIAFDCLKMMPTCVQRHRRM